MTEKTDKTEKKRLVPVRLDGYRPLRDIVFDTMKEGIMKQILKPGERLMEVQLAEEMGVSRTPVREAIRKLEQEGMVVMIPRKGAYVAGLSMKDIHEVFEVRSALEGLAASLAAERITAEELEELQRQVVLEAEATEEQEVNRIVGIDTSFHNMLYRVARNEKLEQFFGILQEQMRRYRSVSLASRERSKIALEEHKAIVDALAEHNGKQAAKLAHMHITNAENAMLSAMERAGELF